MELSAAAPKAPPAVIAVAGGGPADEFFAALGLGWRLTDAQQARLTPAVVAALAAGWTPGELAEVTGANTDGIRSPYAVLAARLSPTELPEPPSRFSRPPWCGECDERTRMLGFDGDAPSPCPRCKPHHASEPRQRGPERGTAPARTPGAARAAGARLPNAGQRPGGRDSVGPWAYDGTRAWRPKGVSRGG